MAGQRESHGWRAVGISFSSQGGPWRSRARRRRARRRPRRHGEWQANERAMDGEPLAYHSQAKEDLGVPGARRRRARRRPRRHGEWQANERAMNGDPLASHSQAKEDLGVPGAKEDLGVPGAKEDLGAPGAKEDLGVPGARRGPHRSAVRAISKFRSCSRRDPREQGLDGLVGHAGAATGAGDHADAVSH
jgi:hypothetical protein